MSTIVNSNGTITLDGETVGPVHACAACIPEALGLGLPWRATLGECGVEGHAERRAAWDARTWPEGLDPEDDGSEPWHQGGDA